MALWQAPVGYCIVFRVVGLKTSGVYWADVQLFQQSFGIKLLRTLVDTVAALPLHDAQHEAQN